MREFCVSPSIALVKIYRSLIVEVVAVYLLQHLLLGFMLFSYSICAIIIHKMKKYKCSV